MILCYIKNGNLLIYKKSKTLKHYHKLTNMESYYMYSFFFHYNIIHLFLWNSRASNVYYTNPNDMTKLKIYFEKH